MGGDHDDPITFLDLFVDKMYLNRSQEILSTASRPAHESIYPNISLNLPYHSSFLPFRCCCPPVTASVGRVGQTGRERIGRVRNMALHGFLLYSLTGTTTTAAQLYADYTPSTQHNKLRIRRNLPNDIPASAREHGDTSDIRHLRDLPKYGGHLPTHAIKQVEIPSSSADAETSFYPGNYHFAHHNNPDYHHRHRPETKKQARPNRRKHHARIKVNEDPDNQENPIHTVTPAAPSLKRRPVNATPVDYGDHHPFIKTQGKDGLGALGLSGEARMQRIRDDELFRPLRISFLNHENDDGGGRKLRSRARVSESIDDALAYASRIWSEALYVVPARGPLPVKGKGGACGNSAPPTSPLRWGQKKVPPSDVLESDLVVYVSLSGKGCEDGPAGAHYSRYGGTCEMDQFGRPISGIVTFCPDSVMDAVDSNALRRSAVQAVGDMLGLHPTSMAYYHGREGLPIKIEDERESNIAYDCVDGSTQDTAKLIPPDMLLPRMSSSSSLYYEITSPALMTLIKEMGCKSVTGVQLGNENGPGSSCFGNHWDKYLFIDELSSSLWISPLALTLLQDSGWYQTAEVKARDGDGCHLFYQNIPG